MLYTAEVVGPQGEPATAEGEALGADEASAMDIESLGVENMVESAAQAPCSVPELLLRAGSRQAEVNKGLAARLSAYQREGVEWLYNAYHGAHRPGCRGGILADGTGLGKTVQTIALIHTLIASGQAPPSSRAGVASVGGG